MSTYASPGPSGGTTHSPLLFVPHATTEPSLRLATAVVPARGDLDVGHTGGRGGTRHCPSWLAPQATTEPSPAAQACDRFPPRPRRSSPWSGGCRRQNRPSRGDTTTARSAGPAPAGRPTRRRLISSWLAPGVGTDRQYPTADSHCTVKRTTGESVRPPVTSAHSASKLSPATIGYGPNVTPAAGAR